MDNLIYRILFSYTAFGGPLYKFYATWSSKECIVNYEIDTIFPDRIEKGELDKDKSYQFIGLFETLINNREEYDYEQNDVYEFIHDVPMCQLVLSEGLRDFELDHWQIGKEFYDAEPLYKMILICDNQANFFD